ncbi:2-amino-4-hydroxy-6-hydroxymethyldihydropteridine diphosphokinase [Amorphus orientalis]|uniref:2-amino-4-hydroxy-6-hydroxymethyldihydropteridine pyrophosphokinase n=1 Tax=Amorphus orientalis TaxID=649198 RepID=A0AAE4ATQ3_9HYPH|nr:2-amino-4-hydroxy-6-hydroxymethyldihydropteridine diphosphokinase [Amorphus orientalis]MDQ0316558.1 2-amino-4-hydroxy-6-hydroxymethyldihydropteridine diphosphokinase [Amorphus orientalis]
MTPVPITLGTGANIGDAQATIARALDRLHADDGIAIDRASPFFATPPWGFEDQDWFVNVCAAGTTTLAPHDLLAAGKRIEAELGRTATFRWGPRVIDIDILTYGDETIGDPDLIIPHKELLNRAFVLIPLATIRPDLRIAGERVADAAARFADDPIREVAPAWVPGG